MFSEKGKLVFNNTPGLNLFTRRGSMEICLKSKIFTFSKGDIDDSDDLNSKAEILDQSSSGRRLCLEDLFEDPDVFTKGYLLTKMLNAEGVEEKKMYHLKKQSLHFENKQCMVLILYDVSQLLRNQSLVSQNKLIQLVSSSCTHELLAPIRCIIQLASSLLDKLHDQSAFVLSDLNVIFNTASFLLNQVQANLDQSLLEQNKFTPRLSEHQLRDEIVKPVLDIFGEQAK